MDSRVSYRKTYKRICNILLVSTAVLLTCMANVTAGIDEDPILVEPCLTGWINFEDTCLYTPTSDLHYSWEDARLYCAKNFQADLVKIDSSELNDVVTRLVVDDSYIGIKYDNVSSSWKWSDGTNLNYSNFEIGDFFENHCALISVKLGTWQYNPCSVPTHFVCQMPMAIVDVPITESGVDPSTDSADASTTQYLCTCPSISKEMVAEALENLFFDIKGFFIGGIFIFFVLIVIAAITVIDTVLVCVHINSKRYRGIHENMVG